MGTLMATQSMIEDMTSAFCGNETDARQRYLFEQSLHALVRLAKSEQIIEIKANVKKLTGMLPIEQDIPQAKVTPRD